MATLKPAKRLAPEETREEEVKCGSCENYLREPKLLSCLHCFCKECTLKVVELSPKSIIRCPTCNEETEVPNNDLTFIPTLSFLENVCVTAHKAKQRAIACDKCANEPANYANRFCRQCGYICQKCEQVHKAFKGLENHEIVDFETLQGDFRRYGRITTEPQKCSTHAKKLKYYCSTCQHLVCRDCFTIGEHKNHKYENVSESKTRFETLETSLKTLHKISLERITSGIRSVEGVKSDIDEQVKMANVAIDEAIREAHQVLDERKMELTEQVIATAKEKHSALDEQLKNLTTVNTEIDRVSRTVDSCLHSENTADIASAHRFMRDKMQGIIHECERIEVTPVAVANIKTELRLPEAIRNSTKIVESSADPTKCSISIDGAVKVGEEATIFVKTAYENDQPCIEQQEVSARLHPEGNTENPITAAVTKSTGKRGEYKCTFTPETRGQHLLHVLVKKQQINDSPFKVYVDMPPMQLNKIARSIEVELPYQAVITSNNQLIVSQSTNPAKITIIDGASHKEFRKEDSYNCYHPAGIAAASDGSVYVVYGEHYIVKYSQEGDKLHEVINAELGEYQLKRPGRIQLNKDETHLYVCDRGHERVVVFNAQNLEPVQVFADQGQYAGIAFGDENDVYLSDKHRNVVLKLINGQQHQVHIGESLLKAPRGLLIKNGYLYVADHNNTRIVVFESTGDHKQVAVFGTEEGESLHDCGSLTVDKDGYIYVCNERGNRIHVF